MIDCFLFVSLSLRNDIQTLLDLGLAKNELSAEVVEMLEEMKRIRDTSVQLEISLWGQRRRVEREKTVSKDVSGNDTPRRSLLGRIASFFGGN